MSNMNKYLTLREVAGHFGVSYPTVSRWCDMGLIEYLRLPSGIRRIPASEIKRLEEHEIGKDQPAAGEYRQQV